MAGRGGRTNWSNAACYDTVGECSPYCCNEVIQDKISEPIKEVINLNPC